MVYYRAISDCYILNTYVPGNGIIGLTEDQEKQLKLGKHVEKKPDTKALMRDPKSKAVIQIGDKNLVKVKATEMAGMEGKPLEDGSILYPPVTSAVQVGNTPGVDGVHATQFQTVR